MGTEPGANLPRPLLEHPDFYALHKPAGWLTHPVRSHGSARAPDLVSYWQGQTGESGLGPPHRLDRETSGTILLSRDPESARRFFVLFRQQLVSKTYLAIVQGEPRWAEQELDAPLGELGLGGGNRVIMRQGVIPDGKPAVTRLRVLERRAGHALIEARPRTGRLHQIRAHLYHLGLPLVGDKIYGTDPDAFLEFRETGQTPELTRRLGLPRQALHAAALHFPWDGAQVRVRDSLPGDMQGFWDGLAETSLQRAGG
ncbi:RluA family pseudouridine synthase [Deinococcus radiophilus]|uniref:RluA family pseudouridine synthase n=1 Tax=Deinococcus radiophilus TaxID=32062 RepID=A0A3S0IPK3_9DEIO|nr:RluA family pseudouridine synthase [Deinococcus radiophilus]RTR28681.1 RluA family pseudouridine synthase [Deinococcus radiophilus]UFA51104.1 RluA family pseudouridine synthase [Deinococcus radiophilus]